MRPSLLAIFRTGEYQHKLNWFLFHRKKPVIFLPQRFPIHCPSEGSNHSVFNFWFSLPLVIQVCEEYPVKLFVHQLANVARGLFYALPVTKICVQPCRMVRSCAFLSLSKRGPFSVIRCSSTLHQQDVLILGRIDPAPFQPRPSYPLEITGCPCEAEDAAVWVDSFIIQQLLRRRAFLTRGELLATLRSPSSVKGPRSMVSCPSH